MAPSAMAQLVEQDPSSGTITIGSGTGGSVVNIANELGESRRLTNVANGRDTTDAINYGQFSSVNNGVARALGGGAAINSVTGAVTAPTYNLYADPTDPTGATVYRDVGSALGNLNNRIKANGDSITNIINGKAGLVQQADATSEITVGKDTGGTAVNFAAGKDADGNAITRKLTNVTAGTEGTDAVNVGQLNGVKATAEQAASDIVNANTLNAANAKTVSDALGGGSTVGEDGKITAPTYSLATSTDNPAKTDFHNVGDALGNLDTRTSQNTTDITNLSTQIGNGSIGLVQQADASSVITVAKDTAGDSVNFAGKDTDGNAITRKLTNVTAGEADTDAANVGQLKAVGKQVADLDANAVKYDANGNVDLARNGKPAQIKNVANGTEDGDAVNLGQLKQSGLVKDDGSLANVVTYDDDTKSKVSLGGASGTTLTNVAAGAVAADSMDAINGAQLYATNQAVASALGTSLGGNGAIIAPSYTVGGQTYNNVGDVFKNLDGRLTGVERGEGSGGNGGSSDPRFIGSGSGNANVGDKENAQATGTNATAAGAKATASANNSVAMGAGSTASHENSVAVGAGSVTDRTDSVSVGAVGQERAITNVMAGTKDTDAVNVQQLKSETAKVQQSVDTLQSQVNQRFDQLDNRVNRVGAMNAAMTTMVASAAGLQTDNRMAIGTGLYRGQTALAVGYQRKVGSRATVTIGGSTAGGSEYNVGIGAGYGW
ncbi:YadA family autotransporter adhesin [Ralstonia sp. 24A2]|uniref:YadA family autotransporter adhesin n=1 Tax=Ralstonia sp. 24A2 TaxID=3447364 RepID=UPI003F6A4EB0